MQSITCCFFCLRFIYPGDHHSWSPRSFGTFSSLILLTVTMHVPHSTLPFFPLGSNLPWSVYSLKYYRFSLCFVPCFLAEWKYSNGKNLCSVNYPSPGRQVQWSFIEHNKGMSEWNTWWVPGLCQTPYHSWDPGIFWDPGPNNCLLGPPGDQGVCSESSLLRRLSLLGISAVHPSIRDSKVLRAHRILLQ